MKEILQLLTLLLQMLTKDVYKRQALDVYLSDRVFAGQKGVTLSPVKEDVEGFNTFIGRFTEGLAIERAAVNSLK